ncbi:amino acid adenylation domain-containing protein [Algoriphagus halophytocola]|uniref:Amino acid adenylation domain-containing protein n=1 Tax=Algoriphagus halophytocola TaxID=2991499 RepID=A0ABY6MM56_9BACT|nr:MULTISPECIES: amino acid adenylation domain-containing protein [unclassified Algoriphagus]UZD23482.1 amino acid adenylation domain-containing protein [Algoriphagus sp. TR-M5]WBL44776.1 amino acid adenylation domain-containing protein [Algoriphagus sp. TR-M9]
MNQNTVILPDMLRVAAQKNPDKLAFISSDSKISYKDLDRKSDQLAHWLQSVGVKKGDRVGILIEKNSTAAFAVYGILKSGAVLVTLDPGQPSQKLNRILSDCNIEVILTISAHQRLIGDLIHSGLKVLGASPGITWEELFSMDSPTPAPINIEPQDQAYILYTSGSTGEPKGIVHTHRSGLAYARQSVRLYQVTAEDVIGNVASLHFDQSTFGYFASVYAGCSTYVFSPGELVMLGSFCAAIAKHDISILYSVPSLFVSILDGGFDLNFPSLRWIKYGGESFPPKKLQNLLRSVPNAKVSNVYGPAEVNQCTYYHLSHPDQVNGEIPIGKVWENTAYQILDEDGKNVMPGEKGELAIHSLTMMTGYWNNEKLNQEAFLTEMRDSGELVQYYRTGDIVYENKENLLVFVGRKDRQIKIDGKRVELQEVEQELLQLEEILQAAVFAINLAGKKELCAAVVPDLAKFDKAQVLGKLKQNLAKHCIPRNIFELKSLPQSDNGKIHYRELEKIFST